MPPKIKKFPKQVLPEADANVLSDVLLRYTTSDLPDVELPPGCAQAKGAWLASFHKSVTRKLRESCADDDEVSASASSSDEGAEALLRLDTLTARVMVAAEAVRSIRADALEASARKQGQSHAKKRKLAAMGAGGSMGSDAFVVPQAARAVAPPLSTENLERLATAVDKTVNSIADATQQMDAQCKSIKGTLSGVKRSIELRANEDRSLGGTLGGQNGVVGEALTALPPMEDGAVPNSATLHGMVPNNDAGLSATEHATDPVRRFGNHLNG